MDTFFWLYICGIALAFLILGVFLPSSAPREDGRPYWWWTIR